MMKLIILLLSVSTIHGNGYFDLLNYVEHNNKFNRRSASYLVDYKNVKKREVCERSGVEYSTDGTAKLDVRFPKAEITSDDQYMCTSHRVPYDGDESYLTKFVPHATMTSSHHMLVYGCSVPASTKRVWNCAMGMVCGGSKMMILYAWARDAPPLTLPPHIGYRIGGNSGFDYIVLQMHYSHKLPPGGFDCSGFSAVATKQPQQFYAGIFLLGSPYINIPAHAKQATSDISCTNPMDATLNVFAFRTHAHSLGKVITGYRSRDGRYKMIGKGNPQWPHAFYPRVGGPIDLKKGDTLVARCTYQSNRDTATYAGKDGGDEMCNFYMMFYTDDVKAVDYGLNCWGNGLGIHPPPDSNELAPYPGYAGLDSINAISRGDAVIPQTPDEHHHHRMGGETPVVQPDNEPAIAENYDEQPEPNEDKTDMEADLSWPQRSTLDNLGQVGGVAVDANGFVHVFHRAYRRWDAQSFDLYTNVFMKPHDPITDNTMYVLDPLDGSIIHQWGANMFYMPHGVNVDSKNYVWVTDVAMHQVMKFPLNGSREALLTLGEKMVPGNDAKHFCKPTDVAVESDGTFYVSDGYCNGRVVKFAPDGTYIMSWGHVGFGREGAPPPEGVFHVVHSIALVQNEENVCVADRENGRIQCFTRNGEFVKIIEHKTIMGKNLYAISYSGKDGGVLYAINGVGTNDIKTTLFAIKYNTSEVVGRWNPPPHGSLSRPHDVAVSSDGLQVFVGQLDGRKIYKFDVKLPHDDISTTNTPTGGVVELIGETRGELDEEVEPDSSVNELDTKEKRPEDELKNASNGSFIIIMVLISLPVLILIIGFIFIRSRKRRLRKYQDLLSHDDYNHYEDQNSPFFEKAKLNLGTFFTKSKQEKEGFERVETAPLSDCDESESEDELYSNTMKRNEDE